MTAVADVVPEAIPDADPGSILETGGLTVEVVATTVLELALDAIDPDLHQVRDEGADADLGAEILPDTILPPIEVRPHPDPARVAAGKLYEIIDGERRWRGSRAAGRQTIRAIVNDAPMDEGDRLLRQAKLNAGKHLKPFEEARSWKRIMTAKDWGIQDLARHLNKAKSTVSDRLALLDAPAPFQALFADGTLTAAAAPVVRQYRELPERVLKDMIADAKASDWYEAIDDGVPVSIELVERGLRYSLQNAEQAAKDIVLLDAETAKQYTGPVATVGKAKYATDVKAWDAANETVEAARRANEKGANAPAKREPDKWELERRAREKRERQAQEKKRAVRRAQWDAIAPKVPTAIDDKWSFFLVECIAREMTNDDRRSAVNALGITPPKKSTYGGFDFTKAIVGHAAMLPNAGARVQLALRLLLAADVTAPSYSSQPASRFIAAAKLLKIDLAKVKPVDPAKKAAAVAKTMDKKTSKKRSAR